MIHSTAGGTMKEYGFFDFAKLKILDVTFSGEIVWAISPFKELDIGNIVEIPLGKEEKICQAEVLRVDRHVYEQNFPIPVKRMKKILRIVKHD